MFMRLRVYEAGFPSFKSTSLTTCMKFRRESSPPLQDAARQVPKAKVDSVVRALLPCAASRPPAAVSRYFSFPRYCFIIDAECRIEATRGLQTVRLIYFAATPPLAILLTIFRVIFDFQHFRRRRYSPRPHAHDEGELLFYEAMMTGSSGSSSSRSSRHYLPHIFPRR